MNNSQGVDNRDNSNLNPQSTQPPPIEQGNLGDRQVCHCINWKAVAGYTALYLTITAVVSAALIVFAPGVAVIGIAAFVGGSLFGIGIGCGLKGSLTCRCKPLNNQGQQAPPPYTEQRPAPTLEPQPSLSANNQNNQNSQNADVPLSSQNTIEINERDEKEQKEQVANEAPVSNPPSPTESLAPRVQDSIPSTQAQLPSQPQALPAAPSIDSSQWFPEEQDAWLQANPPQQPQVAQAASVVTTVSVAATALQIQPSTQPVQPQLPVQPQQSEQPQTPPATIATPPINTPAETAEKVNDVIAERPQTPIPTPPSTQSNSPTPTPATTAAKVEAVASEKPAVIQQDVKLSFEDQMLKDIRVRVHEDVYTLFKTAIVDEFKKSNSQVFKSWECKPDGTFSLKFTAPQKKWVPAYAEDGETLDPPFGVVQLYGINDDGEAANEITGKLSKGKIEISSGWSIYADPDKRSAGPGYLSMKEITVLTPGVITIYTSKDLKKEYSGFILSVVSAIANTFYGKVDKNYVLTVHPRHLPVGMLIENWTKHAEAAVINNNEAECIANAKSAFKKGKIKKTGLSRGTYLARQKVGK